MEKQVGSRASYLLVDEKKLEIIDMTNMNLIEELEHHILAFIKKNNTVNVIECWKIYIDKNSSYDSADLQNTIDGFYYAGIKNKVYFVNGKFIFINEENRLEQLWDLNENTIKIVINDNTDRYFIIQEIYVAIRILTSYIISENNFALIHATAVTYNNKGILIIGNKGSGKSTLTSSLLNKNCRLVAVDRCFMWQKEQNIHLSGWVSTCRVDEKSLEISLDSDMVKRLLDYKDKFSTNKRYIVNDKFRYPTYDFIKLINRDSQHEARLNSVIILGECSSIDSLLEEISEDIGIEYLKKNSIDFELPFCKMKKFFSQENDFNQVKFYKLNRREKPASIAKEIIQNL
jgi:adenylate kinase family enzyme